MWYPSANAGISVVRSLSWKMSGGCRSPVGPYCCEYGKTTVPHYANRRNADSPHEKSQVPAPPCWIRIWSSSSWSCFLLRKSCAMNSWETGWPSSWCPCTYSRILHNLAHLFSARTTTRFAWNGPTLPLWDRAWLAGSYPPVFSGTARCYSPHSPT